MKILGTHRQTEQGSVLLVTLFIASMFGLFLYYHLNIVREQRGFVARSQAWNAALSVAEAGVEETLAHLNPGAPRRNIVFSSDGWNLDSGLYGPMSRSLSQGSYSVSFTDAAFPKIYATGYVSVASSRAELRRVIEVCTTNSPLFNAAMAARYNIDLRGNGVNTDSFNSLDPRLMTGGRYDPAKASTNGDIASIAGLINVVNASVNGSVLLGPTAADTVSKGGYVSGGVNNDFNVEFEDVILPDGTATWLQAAKAPRTIDGVTYDYVFDSPGGSLNFTINNLAGSIYVATNTTVVLLLTGDAALSTLRVAGQGALAGSLTLYMTGNRFSMSGGSKVDGGSALNFGYYGLPSNTEITFGGNADFTGTIYAPQADFSLGGGGSGTYDFVGASLTKSVRMNGHFNFHFDEALLTAGPKRPYVASSWREI